MPSKREVTIVETHEAPFSPEVDARDFRSVSSLILLPDNPRHGDIGAISQSLERFGQQKPIVINSDGVILAGNHTFQAAVALGWEEIWVHESDLEGVDQPGFALADNRLSDLATYDHDALLRFLEEQPDLTGTGYDGDDMDRIASDLNFDKRGYDGEVREPPKEPTTKVGDIWLLDNHRLICGDALTREVSDTVTGFDLLLTDPPWGVSFKGLGGRSITGDSTEAAFPILFQLYFSKLTGWLYIFAGSNAVALVGRLWDLYLHRPPGILVWDKGAFVMSQNGYHYGWEPIFYGYTEGLGHRWFSGRTGIEASDVLRFDRPENRTHPNEKPVPMLEQLIRNTCPPDGSVCDPFAGSGSTLMAAANTGRTATLIEIEPAWCDVIIDRYRDVYPEADIRKA